MFSIVIPTWNNLAHLQLVVRSIREHSAEAHQIVVHVNDGSDGSLEWVRAEGLELEERVVRAFGTAEDRAAGLEAGDVQRGGADRLRARYRRRDAARRRDVGA